MNQNLIKLLKNYKTLCISLGVLIVIISFFLFQAEKPSSLNGMLRTGENYTKEGKLALALEHYTRTAKCFPWNYEVHMRLGKLFIQVNEIQKAKIEYYRAINLKGINRYEAHFELANIYISENNYKLAHEILMEIKNIPNKDVMENLGNLYYRWGHETLKNNKFDAIRKFRESIEYYQKAKSKNLIKTRNSLEKTYAKIADDLVANNKIAEAIRILGISIEFHDNALAHHKLGQIYQTRNLELAIMEFEKAFSLPRSDKLDQSGYAQVLIKSGNLLREQGNEIQAKYYFYKAEKIQPNQNASYIKEKNIILMLLGGKYNEDTKRDLIIPGISFKIMNISKEEIEYLKAKVVFVDNNVIFDEKIIVIAEPGSPMQSDAITEVISIFSQRPLQKVFAKHNIKVQIYLSQDDEDNWKLYRNAFFDKVPSSKIKLDDD